MDQSYKREVNYWSPMIWCVKAQNPEGNTTLTPCNMLIEEDQAFSYTTSNPDHTEVSPASAVETLTALDTLKRASVARLLEPTYDADGERQYEGEFEELRTRDHGVTEDNSMGTNGKHLQRLFGGMASAMNALNPLKKLGLKYGSHFLSNYIGQGGADAASDLASSVWDAVQSGLKRRAEIDS